MSKQTSRGVPVAMGAAVAVFGVAVAGFVAMQPAEPTIVEVHAPPNPPASNTAARPDAAEVSPTPAGPQPTPAADPQREPSPTPNRLARDLQREQIWRALGRKHALEPAKPGSAAPTDAAAELLPTLDRKYVQTAIQDQLVPVAVDCYDTLLETKADAAGRVVLEFTIIGDEEVGGVVESVALSDDTTLGDEFLSECLRESLIAVSFPPPKDGGRVMVRYPLEFSPDDPAD